VIHVVLSKTLDLARIAAEAAADKAPGHVLADLAKAAPTAFHMPGGDRAAAPTHVDTLRAKLFGRPDLWALARRVAAAAGPDDVVFCTGEDVGIPVAAVLAHRPSAPRLAVFAHNLNRPRARMALRVFRCLPAVTHWLTNAQTQAAFLTGTLSVPAADVHLIPEQTDTGFFTPGPRPLLTFAPPAPASHPALAPSPPAADGPAPRRPIIVSVGLEQRDYRTLAAATETMPVDVRISGFSKDARAMKDAFPDPMPANMSRAFYDWPALRDLYRAADLVVVPLFNNPYCAGLTAMLEGLACEKPVIISRTDGLASYLRADAPPADAGPPQAGGAGDICLPVPPENPAALETAIKHLLQTPGTGQSLAVRGRAWLLARHTPAHWLAAVLDVLSPAPAEVG
jgi:glycosyltransferase involved in cell wall biosynthesis